MGYVMAVRASHALTAGSGRTVTAAGAVRMIPVGGEGDVRVAGDVEELG